MLGQNRPVTENRRITSVMDELDAIVLQPPNWLMRSGMSMMLLCCVIIGGLSYFISYPEVITTPALITTLNPPIEIITPKEGLLNNVFKLDREKVNAGDRLFYIGDNAKLVDIELAKNWLLSVENINTVEQLNLRIAPPTDLALGKLATAWLQVFVAWNNRKDYIESANPKREIKQLNEEIAITKVLNEANKQQNYLGKKELESIKSGYERNLALVKEGVISKKDFEDAEKLYLSAQKQYESQITNLIDRKLRFNQINKEKGKLTADFSRQLTELNLDFRQKTRDFIIALDAWNNEHLITSPVAGQLSLYAEIQVNKYIKGSEVLGSIVPESDNMEIVVKCMVPQSGAGLLEVGNAARISIDAFSSDDWGVMEGIVQRIGLVPIKDKDMNYSNEVEIALPHQLRTNTGKTINFRHNMSARAEIITEKKRLIHRFLGSLYTSWKKMQ